ncbi:MAG: hypothetical protein DRN17_07480 [Thermoplasmata archaeon]|nr:MAG: hypothetical protein DRN17_07480 [Thermoplasmata archaeon]
MTTLSELLIPVVSNAAQLLQITEHDTEEIAVDDLTVQLSASVAYSQITSYLNRKILKATFIERYVETIGEFKLRNLPIGSITSVTESSTLLVEGIDYELVGGTLNLFSTSVSTIDRSGIDTETTYTPTVEYVGGVSNLMDYPDFLNGLLLQTVAVYNRKDTLGIVRAQAKGGAEIHATDTYNPDAGDILEAVEMILQPYIYFGNAEEL